LKVKVNNKPAGEEDRTKHSKAKRVRKRFKSLEDLMGHVELLEKRIEQLESLINK
jgi:ubiquinone biosynthesis protein UbiJ